MNQYQHPALICASCLHDLSQASQLRKKAIEGDKIFQQQIKYLINSNDFLQKNLLEPEIAIKLENDAGIKAEPIDSSTTEGHFELLQNIDSIIKNCTTVHDTIFEDVNQRFMNENNSNSDDEEDTQMKRKYRRKKNRDKLSTTDDNHRHIACRKQKRSRKSIDDKRMK